MQQDVRFEASYSASRWSGRYSGTSCRMAMNDGTDNSGMDRAEPAAPGSRKWLRTPQG